MNAYSLWWMRSQWLSKLILFQAKLKAMFSHLLLFMLKQRLQQASNVMHYRSLLATALCYFLIFHRGTSDTAVHYMHEAFSHLCCRKGHNYARWNIIFLIVCHRMSALPVIFLTGDGNGIEICFPSLLIESLLKLSA